MSMVRGSATPRVVPTSVSGMEWVSLAVAATLVLVIGLLVPHEPDRVSVTIDNQTDHRMYISATTPVDPTASKVAIVSPRTLARTDGVLDRGEEWVLELRTLGSPAATMTVTRAELVDETFTIPPSVGERLAAAGVEPDVPSDGPGGR